MFKGTLRRKMETTGGVSVVKPNMQAHSQRARHRSEYVTGTASCPSRHSPVRSVPSLWRKKLRRSFRQKDSIQGHIQSCWKGDRGGGRPDCSCNPPTCSFAPFHPTICSLRWCAEIFPGTSGASLSPFLFPGCAKPLTCAGCHTRRQAHREAEERHRGFHFWLWQKIGPKQFFH